MIDSTRHLSWQLCNEFKLPTFCWLHSQKSYIIQNDDTIILVELLLLSPFKNFNFFYYAVSYLRNQCTSQWPLRNIVLFQNSSPTRLMTNHYLVFTITRCKCSARVFFLFSFSQRNKYSFRCNVTSMIFACHSNKVD